MGYQRTVSNRHQSASGKVSLVRISQAVRLVVLLAGCAAFAGPAAAQGANSPAVTSATGDPYKACTDGTANEDRATCMKEVAAAKAEAKRGQLTNAGGAYDANALQRCDALPADQKEPCRLRILGAGTTSGSVAGGGIVREVTTQNPTPDNAAPMPGATSGSSAGATTNGTVTSPR